MVVRNSHPLLIFDCLSIRTTGSENFDSDSGDVCMHMVHVLTSLDYCIVTYE
jgi:hypothetical protein